jgi:hypothetical protein
LAAAWDFAKRYIDFGMAWKGAAFLGTVVYVINLPHGPWAALPAALKQAAYTYLVAGFVTRLAENLAVNIDRRALALLAGLLVPSCVAIGLTFTLHSLKGTPEPFYSTVPTMLTAPPAFLWWASRKRNQFDASQSPQTETA